MKKEFNIQIFDSNATFLGSISYDRFKNPVNFTEEINGGQKELNLDFSYKFDDFPDYLTPFNFVRVFAVTEIYPKGIIIYSGWISQVVPYVVDRDEGVEVVCLGLATMLNLSLYKDGSNFDVTKTNEDPGDIVEDIITNHQAVYPPTTTTEWIGTNQVIEDGILIRQGENVDLVGSLVDSFVFQKQTWFKAMQKTLELSGEDWFWFIDRGGDVIFKQKPTTETHTFTIDKDVQNLSAPRNVENIINDVTVKNKGADATSSDATSISLYGKREKYINESSSDNGAAQKIADQTIAENKDPKIVVEVVVNSVYDIESINAGDSCTIQNYKKDAPILNENMLIVSKAYDKDRVTLSLEQKGLNFGGSLLKFVQTKS